VGVASISLSVLTAEDRLVSRVRGGFRTAITILGRNGAPR